MASEKKTPRQENIKIEEAKEIGRLAVELYQTNKEPWGLNFWKQLERKGSLSKDRGWSTLRNFARNVSIGTSRFKWDEIFPGIPRQGQIKGTPKHRQQQRKHLELVWDPARVREVATKLAGEVKWDFASEKFWVEFRNRHETFNTPEQLRELFLNFDPCFFKQCGLDEDVLKTLRLRLHDENLDVFSDADSKDANDFADDSSNVRNDIVGSTSCSLSALALEPKEGNQSATPAAVSDGLPMQTTPSNVVAGVEGIRKILFQKPPGEVNHGVKIKPMSKEDLHILSFYKRADTLNPVKPVKRENSNDVPGASAKKPKVDATDTITYAEKLKISEKTTELVNEVEKWWIVLENVGKSEDKEHRELFRFIKETVHSFMMISKNIDVGVEAEDDNLLPWIRAVMKNRWNDAKPMSQQLSIGVLRCVCMGRKTLELYGEYEKRLVDVNKIPSLKHVI